MKRFLAFMFVSSATLAQFPLQRQWLDTADNGGVNIGYYAGAATPTSDAIRLGFFAGAGPSVALTSSVAIGRHAGYEAHADQSVMLGHAAGQYAGKGSDASSSVVLGYLAGRNDQQTTPHHGFLGVVIGAGAAQRAHYQTATILGAWAGSESTTVAGSVLIGFSAGRTLARNQSLVIDSGQDLGAGSFIYGEFDTRMLRFNVAKIGFLGAEAVARPSVTGNRSTGSAFMSLLQALSALGLITDTTTP